MEYYFKSLIENLKQLISIDSSENKPEKDKPFGIGNYLALNFTLKLANEMGFKTYNYDNYVGEIVWGENENNPLAILAHLDVVPYGKLSDWKTEPFVPTIKNGILYGRGAIDDKGPLLATLYALKQLKDEGFIPSRQIRFILGCNEESGWRCIEHYKLIRSLPDEGFSPDASFPVIYAEKGIIHACFEFNLLTKNINSVLGGVAANVVCDYAYISGKINNDIAKSCELIINENKAESFGKTAHGSKPEQGINAIEKITKYLSLANEIDNTIYDKLFGCCNNLKKLYDETGNLTFSPNIVKTENNKIYFTVDIRYPSTLNENEILNKLKNIGPFTVLHHQKPLYNNKNGKLITTLLKVYNEETGKNLSPIAIGGGTYARALKYGAAFGPEEENSVSTAHQPNECISLNQLDILLKIYKKAIFELTK